MFLLYSTVSNLLLIQQLSISFIFLSVFFFGFQLGTRKFVLIDQKSEERYEMYTLKENISSETNRKKIYHKRKDLFFHFVKFRRNSFIASYKDIRIA